MKRMLGLILALALAASFAVAAQARTAGESSMATGTTAAQNVTCTKVVSDYHGSTGEHCTILSSNLNSIRAGINVVYLGGSVQPRLDSDLSSTARTTRWVTSRLTSRPAQASSRSPAEPGASGASTRAWLSPTAQTTASGTGTGPTRSLPPAQDD